MQHRESKLATKGVRGPLGAQVGPAMATRHRRLGFRMAPCLRAARRAWDTSGGPHVQPIHDI